MSVGLFSLNLFLMIVSNQKFKNCYTAEISILATTATNQLQFQFPDFPYLRTKKIQAITASTNEYGIQSGYPNYCRVASNNSNNLNPLSTFLSLQDSTGKMFVQNMPLQELISTKYVDTFNATGSFTDSNVNGILFFDPRIIVWTKSYISTPSPLPLPALGLNLCFQFNVFYI